MPRDLRLVDCFNTDTKYRRVSSSSKPVKCPQPEAPSRILPT
jgi:hypothetical protein